MSVEEDLAVELQEDLTWRIKELSELVRACSEGTVTRKQALLRAAVPILYAHWEGYFIKATNSYLNFLSRKRLLTGLLKDEFWALSVRRRFKPQQLIGDDSFTSFLLDIRNEKDRIWKKGNFERISGKSNLRSDVLISCCKFLAIDVAPYEQYFYFIDKEIADKRNFIAHGYSLKFSHDDMMRCRDKVVELMRITQNEIENCAVVKAYLKEI